MIEKIVTSKTRVKLLNLFLTHIDARYYLRELERMLDESLSPLRRQLLKLVKMGILVIEEEANIKYYYLNKNFEGMDELRKLVLGNDYAARELALPDVIPAQAGIQDVIDSRFRGNDKLGNGNDEDSRASSAATTLPKRVKYDFVVLTLISIFVLATSMFVLYASTSSMKKVTGLVSEKNTTDVISKNIAQPTRPDEMISKRWKVVPGNVPALSTGEIEGTKKSKKPPRRRLK